MDSGADAPGWLFPRALTCCDANICFIHAFPTIKDIKSQDRDDKIVGMLRLGLEVGLEGFSPLLNFPSLIQTSNRTERSPHQVEWESACQKLTPRILLSQSDVGFPHEQNLLFHRVGDWHQRREEAPQGAG